MAISSFPLRAAVIHVISSGREVPKATIVNPMKLSLNPKILASSVALSIVISLPITIAASPPNVIKISLKSVSPSSSSAISSVTDSPCLANLNRYPKKHRNNAHRMTPSMRWNHLKNLIVKVLQLLR